jgi:AbrB family looped-hinge helix DNA binding protein
LIAALCDEVGLADIVNSVVRWDERQWKLSPGVLCKALVVNVLAGRKPLYRVEQFYVGQDVEKVFGKGVRRESYAYIYYPARALTLSGLCLTLDTVRRFMGVWQLNVITLSGKGQVVIPKEIRQKYNLKKGDRLLVREASGKIILEITERHPILSLRGAFKGKGSLTHALLEERRTERRMEAGQDG